MQRCSEGGIYPRPQDDTPQCHQNILAELQKVQLRTSKKTPKKLISERHSSCNFLWVKCMANSTAMFALTAFFGAASACSVAAFLFIKAAFWSFVGWKIAISALIRFSWRRKTQIRKRRKLMTVFHKWAQNNTAPNNLIRTTFSVIIINARSVFALLLIGRTFTSCNRNIKSRNLHCETTSEA